MLCAAATMGCGSTFKPTFCDIVNSNVLQCNPTDPNKKSEDISTIRAIGYRCVSPDDWKEGKRRIREALEIEASIFGIQGE